MPVQRPWSTLRGSLRFNLATASGEGPPEGRPAEAAFPPRAPAPVTTSGLDGAPLEPGEGERDEAAVDQLLSLAAAAKKGKVPGGDRPAREPRTKGLGQMLADKAQSLEDGKKSRRKSGPTGGLLSGDDDAPSRSKATT